MLHDTVTIVNAPTFGSAQTADTADAVGLSWWEAVILGLVEGITEYLPVSSTGHLLFVAELLGLTETQASEDSIETFVICIQVGAIAAVLFLYRERIQSMIDGLFGRSDEGRAILIRVIAAFVPTAIIGLAFQFSSIRDTIFSPEAIVAAWLVGGALVVWLSARSWFRSGTRELSELTVQHAVLIGLAQSIAIWPGVSRSLVTIMAAVAVGLTLRAAVEFAFLLGVITLGAATVVEGAQNGGAMIDTFGWATPLLGLVVGFVSAVIAVKWMVSYLEERGFAFFGWYRLAIGALGLVLILAGVFG